MKFTQYIFIILTTLSCKNSGKRVYVDSRDTVANYRDTVNSVSSKDSQSIAPNSLDGSRNKNLNIHDLTQHELVDFAKTLIGIPYKYASTNPSNGFDCSGFITYVFNHFDIEVPRSSADFTNVGKEISLKNAKEGDLILFTGTIDSIKAVGHMGIVTESSDTLRFIHSTSGRANGVTISKLDDHYKKRFVKVIRVFPE